MDSPAVMMTHTGGDEPTARVPAVINVRVITPMVFWASLVPCARETSEAEITWPLLNPRPIAPWSARLVMR